MMLLFLRVFHNVLHRLWTKVDLMGHLGTAGRRECTRRRGWCAAAPLQSRQIATSCPAPGDPSMTSSWFPWTKQHQAPEKLRHGPSLSIAIFLSTTYTNIDSFDILVHNQKNGIMLKNPG